MYDVTVIGAGLAGLQLARLLARAGASVLLVDARRDVTECVRTTGIFVRRTFDDFPMLHPFLGASIRSIGLHSPSGRRIDFESANDEFRAGRMKPLYAAMLSQAIAAGATWSPATTYSGLELRSDHVRLLFRDGSSVRSRFIAGADGSHSPVARDLRLDRNHRWLTGVEHVYRSSSGAAPRFDCWIDPAIAPGYLAWLVDDGEEIHAGVGGDARRFDPATAFRAFETRLRERRFLPGTEIIERRGGHIPVGGVLRRIANRRGLLVGDAAGAVSPLTAGGLDACMRLSQHAASVLIAALRDGDRVLESYDGSAFRARFASRLAMRRMYDMATRSPLAVEAGFVFARTIIASAFVRHVFFGRGSFPDLSWSAAKPPLAENKERG